MLTRPVPCCRRGAVTPLAAVLMVFLLGMVAFTVDIGYIVQTHEELQNAADSAAMAGAAKLLDYQLSAALTIPFYQDTLRTNAANAAIAEAKKFGELNRGGGVQLVLNTSDITVGYQGSPASQNSFQPMTTGSPFPNAVRVVVRRDATVSTGPLKLAFAPVLGINTQDVQATATAAYQGGANVTGFNSPPGGPNSLLLPITLDVGTWTTVMTTGRMPDGNVYDSYKVQRPTPTLQPPNNVTVGMDGIPEIPYLYPDNTTAGNFGQVQLFNPGVNENATDYYRKWINNGPSPSDLQSFGVNGLQVGSLIQPLTLKGSTGIQSTLQSNLAGIIGQPRILPLYSTVTGPGNNATYTIVAFVGVTVVEATGRGNSGIQIVIQPTSVIDPTATLGPVPATGVTSQFVFRPLALTR
jgi:Flp pilus assembly protein TadG